MGYYLQWREKGYLVLAAMPYGGADQALGERTSNRGPGLISPPEDEQRLASLVPAVDLILDRYEETMLLHSTTPALYSILSAVSDILSPA